METNEIFKKVEKIKEEIKKLEDEKVSIKKKLNEVLKKSEALKEQLELIESIFVMTEVITEDERTIKVNKKKDVSEDTEFTNTEF